jgi:Domain of unknown function (DUF4836)
MKLRNLTIAFALILFISSCKSKKTIDVLIPEDAGMVIHINAASLTSKLSWDEIKQSDWFKMANEKGRPDDFQRRLLDNPETSGIDTKGDMYMFMKNDGKRSYMFFTGKIKDAAAFETTVKKMKEGTEVKKEGSMNYTGENDNMLTWTKDKFIVIADAGDLQGGLTGRYSGNTGDEKSSAEKMLALAEGIYDLKSSKSIGNNSKFAALISEPGDAHLWLSSSAMTGGMIPKEIAMFKAASLIEGNISTATFNFDNGKITVKTNNYYNKELAAFFDNNKGGNISEDMLKKIPGQNVSAVIAMNYPPSGLAAFLKLLGVDGIANGFLSKAGFTVEDFVKANKGDLLIAVSDFEVAEKENTIDMDSGKPYVYKSTKPDAKVLFAASVKDKAAFEKLIDVIKQQMKDEGGMDDMPGVKYELKDNWFVVSNDAANISGFAAGNTNHAFISKISGHPFGGYIDIQKFISGYKGKEGSTEKSIADESMKMWQDVIFYGGDHKGDGATGYFEINMMDKNTNSLKQLNNYFSSMAKLSKEQENKDAVDNNSTITEEVATDSVKMAPPAVKVK